MPFDGRVVQTGIDEGQFITAGAPIATATMTATKAIWTSALCHLFIFYHLLR
ncbi:MAG: hypothetical protein ACYTCN_04110 [Planctomycetota bacterium]